VQRFVENPWAWILGVCKELKGVSQGAGVCRKPMGLDTWCM